MNVRGTPRLRRLGWFLIAAALWTVWVWSIRLLNLASDERSTSFLVVHYVIGALSALIGIGVGYAGIALVKAENASPDESVDRHEDEQAGQIHV